jgi:hypothetical protein
MTPFGYVIFSVTRNAWLQDDERSWGPWSDAAQFTYPELANDIREREAPGDAAYVMAVY